jgi:hypothetical protein
MRLTQLVKDPFADFGENDEPSATEIEARQAVRDVLDEIAAADAAEETGESPDVDVDVAEAD